MIDVHEPTNSLLLKVVDPFYVRELIPKSKILDHPRWNIACERSADALLLLKNLGYEIGRPERTLDDYKWPGKHKPMAHQKEMVDFYLTHRKGFNLSEPGTCKTAATLWACDYLMWTGKINKVLILSPLSTLVKVWRQEIFDVLMHRKCVVVHGTREKRKQLLDADVDFYIVNHDGICIGDVYDTLVHRHDIDTLVVDEGSMFRNSGTRKYKCLARLAKKFERIWWLTGTPVPNAPTDAWAQARIINTQAVPEFFGAFKRETMTQVTTFKWVPKPGSHHRAFEALQPAVRFKKQDCLDLPPVVTISLQAGLSDEQKHAFDTMRTHMRANVENQTLTAVNAADKIGKLRQVLCGVVKGGKGDYLAIDHRPRLKVLHETILCAAAKVIVVVPFKGITQFLERELKRHWSVGVLNGDVSIHQRNRILDAFKTTADPHVLLCHPKVMAHGLNLTEADTLIFYAPIYSNDEHEQVIERFNRAGQKRKMTIVRLGAHPLEWQIYRMVDEKRLTQQSVLQLYKEIVG